MSKIVIALSLLLAGSASAMAAEDRCLVTDPTGTPLNVRTGPGQHGMVIGTIENGHRVYVVDHLTGDDGKPWAFIADYGTRRDIGWVYRDYISCV